MKTVELKGTDLPAGKRNLEELTDAIAAATNTPREQIAVNYQPAALIEKEVVDANSNVVRLTEQREETIIVTGPEAMEVAKVLPAVKSHAPELDDAEAVAKKAEEETWSRLIDNKFIKQLMSEFEQLKERVRILESAGNT